MPYHQEWAAPGTAALRLRDVMQRGVTLLLPVRPPVRFEQQANYCS